MRFVDSLGKPAIGGWIYGRVGLFQPSFSVDSDEESRPVDGATVFLDGADVPRRTTTVNGRFEFVGLPNGRYEVSVQMPQGLPPAKSLRLPEGTTEDNYLQLSSSVPILTRTITIAHARACGYPRNDQNPKTRV
jgi:Carboxypeptidase regulatory-like domain